MQLYRLTVNGGRACSLEQTYARRTVPVPTFYERKFFLLCLYNLSSYVFGTQFRVNYARKVLFGVAINFSIPTINLFFRNANCQSQERFSI